MKNEITYCLHLAAFGCEQCKAVCKELTEERDRYKELLIDIKSNPRVLALLDRYAPTVAVGILNALEQPEKTT